MSWFFFLSFNNKDYPLEDITAQRIKKHIKKTWITATKKNKKKKRESTLDYTCYAEQKDSYRMAGIAKKRAPEQWESVEKSFFVCKEMKYRKAL